MRVLRLIARLDPRIGGPAVTALNSAVATSRAGVATDVAAVVRPADLSTDWWSDVVRRCEDERIRLMAFETARTPTKYDLSSSLARWLIRKAGRYDVIHADSPWTGAGVASLAASLRRVPVVITPHEVFTRFDMSNGSKGTRTAKRIGVRVFGRTADLIVCSSELELRDAASCGLRRRRLAWVYHPVVDEHYHAPQPPHRNPARGLRVGYIGRLHRKKNVDLLIEAIADLNDRGHDVSLLIAGAGDSGLEEELRAQAERREGARVTFAGWVSATEKPWFFEQIDVLAMASTYECFGVAAIEGLAAGVPVVVSDRVGVAPIIEQHGVGAVVSPHVAAVAEAIERLHRDRDRLTDAAARARQAAETETSFGAYGRRIVQLYDGILGRRRG